MKEKLTRGAEILEPGSAARKTTGSWRDSGRPSVTDECVGCGICVWVCPEGAIKLGEKKGKKKAEINYDYCKGCFLCVSECPKKAVRVEKEEKNG
jgi:2-oxoacid:acceptor oxidoreductase delta subunit (pyruvate/2-ketoisovalerate family)